MLGALNPVGGPDGNVEFEREVEIERPATEVYPLLDWADPRHAKRQLGDQVESVACEPGRFRLIMADLPGHVFEMEVTEAAPPSAYGYGVEIRPPIGRLAASHERYSLEPLEAGRCRVTLVNKVAFVEGMDMDALAVEIGMMTIACHNALAKLKIQAEQGVEAVRAEKHKTIV